MLATTLLSNFTFHRDPFGCKLWWQSIQNNSRHRFWSFYAQAAQPFEGAVLFDSNLIRGPSLGQVVDFDLLLCTGFDSEDADLFLCHSFTQRPMNERKFERNEKKSDSSRPAIYKALNPFWLSNWVSIARVVACFSQASPQRQRLLPIFETNCVFCSPVQPAQAVPERGAKRSAIDLQSKPSIVFGNSILERLGLELGLKLNSAAWPTGCKGAQEIPE